jgi:hypothetical protein
MAKAKKKAKKLVKPKAPFKLKKKATTKNVTKKVTKKKAAKKVKVKAEDVPVAAMSGAEFSEDFNAHAAEEALEDGLGSESIDDDELDGI